MGNGELQPPVGDPEAQQLEGEKKAVDVVLSITLKAVGGMVVSAPGAGQFYDEPLCLWILDQAKDFIKLSNAKKRQSGIIVPGQTLRRPV